MPDAKLRIDLAISNLDAAMHELEMLERDPAEPSDTTTGLVIHSLRLLTDTLSVIAGERLARAAYPIRWLGKR